MANKVSIIIPAFNEEQTIQTLLEKVLAQVQHFESEIIVVNDGSKDKTLEKVKPFLDKIIFVDLPENKGKGRAIREGLKNATGDIVILQDADLELDPIDYPKLINPIIQGKAEVVYGSRISDKMLRKNSLFFWGGQCMTLLANMLYGVKITDQTNGYKIMRRHVLESMKLESEGFEICSEMTAKVSKMGFNIFEVPVSYLPRNKKEGKKLKIKDGVKSAFTLIKWKLKK